MITNTIDVRFNGSRMAFVEPEYRYNSGVYLRFVDIDLPEAYQVHFANSQHGNSLESVGDANGVRIPDDVWASNAPIFAWIYLHPTNGSAVTRYEVRIPKQKRAELPDGTEPTPAEQTVIDQAIAALNSAVAKTAADAVQTGLDAESAAQSASEADAARDEAVAASTAAAQSEANAAASTLNAVTSATNALASEQAAATSAVSAATSADRAEQAAQDAGYMFFEIDENGDLIYERTSNVNVDFSLEDGDLYVEAIE